MDSSRVWSKPELTILGRGAPEENVLCYCKTRPAGCGVSSCARKVNRHVVQSWRYHTS